MKKKSTALEKVQVFVDCENVPGKHAKEILNCVRREYGSPNQITLYGLQKDPATKAWKSHIKCDSRYSPFCIDKQLCGGPTRNKVDKKIIRDLERISDKDATVVVVSSDHGYTNAINELRSKGNKVIGIGRKEHSKALENSCNDYWVVK